MRGIIFDGDPCPATSQPLKVLSKDNKRLDKLHLASSLQELKKILVYQ
jgi:dimethylsulfoniopropionate demethylase